MSDSAEDKIMHVTWDGRLVTNTNALLRDPKVQETIERISKMNRRYVRRRGAVRIVRRSTTDD
jgi:hypothetical protein